VLDLFDADLVTPKVKKAVQFTRTAL